MIPGRLLRALLPGFSLLVSLPLALSADTLVLRDGTELKGKVLSQTQFSIRVQTDAGPRVVAKSNIRRLIYGELPKKEEVKKPVAPPTKKSAEPAAKKPESVPARASAPAGDSRGTIARSMILPGLGQMYTGRTGKGTVFAGLFLGAVGLAVNARAGFDAARESYDDPVPFLVFRGAGSGGLIAGNLVYGQRFAALTEARSRYELSLVFAAGVWLANLVDIVFFSSENVTSYIVPYALDDEQGAVVGVHLRW